MSILEHDLIDGIALDGQQLVLMISDHLDWGDEYDHLIELQEKINAYIAFCENGQYKKIYPNVDITSAVIQIHFMYDFPESCRCFLSQVQMQLCGDGIAIECYLP